MIGLHHLSIPDNIPAPLTLGPLSTPALASTPTTVCPATFIFAPTFPTTSVFPLSLNSTPTAAVSSPSTETGPFPTLTLLLAPT